MASTVGALAVVHSLAFKEVGAPSSVEASSELSSLFGNWTRAWSARDPEIITSVYSQNARFYSPLQQDSVSGLPKLLEHVATLKSTVGDAEFILHRIDDVGSGYMLRWSAHYVAGANFANSNIGVGCFLCSDRWRQDCGGARHF